MAWVMNHNWLKSQLDAAAKVDFDGDTLKVKISTVTYTPSASAHDFIDDVRKEVSGTNYTAGGPTLDNVTVTLAAGVVTVDCDDEVIAQHASGFSTGRNLTLYKDTGTASTSPIIAHYVAASDFGNVSGDLTLQPAATGLFTVS